MNVTDVTTLGYQEQRKNQRFALTVKALYGTKQESII